MAFSNIENSEKLEVIDIAVVENENFKNASTLKNALDNLSNEESEEKIFNIKYVEEQEAKELLKSSDISGYIIIEETEPKVVVMQNGINQTILKYVIEEIMQTEHIFREVMELVKNEESNIKDISKSNLSYIVIEFYTLIAMTCLYGGILGMTTVNQNLANMSNNGKRVSVSPVKKGKLILSSVLASYVVQLIGIALLFIYTIFILKVDYGNNLGLIILLSLVRCFSRTFTWSMCIKCI